MNEAALRLLISDLEHRLSSLDGWLHFWTILVILGCAGELYFVVHEYREDHKIWFNAKTRGLKLPEKPSFKTLICEVLSVAFVVIGISGELDVDRKSGDLQLQLREANGSLFLLLEKEAGDAKDSAKSAAEQADKAMRDLVATEYVLSDRGIGNENALRKALARFKGERIKVESYKDDDEAYAFCKQLSAIIAQPKLGLKPVSSCDGYLEPRDRKERGIIVMAPNKTIVDSMVCALAQGDINGTIRPSLSSMPPRVEYIEILVASKSRLIGKMDKIIEAAKAIKDQAKNCRPQ
jgi:hypothetical protein